MIRKLAVIFCDNEHGTGDVTFPDIGTMDSFDTQQEFLKERPIGALRKDAKQAGWGHVNGADYCPGCMESGV